MKMPEKEAGINDIFIAYFFLHPQGKYGSDYFFLPKARRSGEKAKNLLPV
jgi:hypothetical protein